MTLHSKLHSWSNTMMPKHPESATRLFLRLFALIQPYRKHILRGVIAAPLMGLLSLAPPYFTKLLFDQAGVGYDYSLMTLLVIGILSFSIASALAEATLSYYSNYLNIKLESTLHLLFFNHVQHLPYRFFYQRQTGEISSRFQELKQALESVHSFLNITVGQGIYLLVIPPFLFWLHWQLALVAIATLPITSAIVYWTSKQLRNTWRHVVESHANLEATQVQMLNQIASIKLLQLEAHSYQKTSRQLTQVLHAHLRAQGISALLQLTEKLVNILSLAIFTWFGWRFVMRGEISLGDFVAFTAYIGYLRYPATDIIGFFSQFQHWAVHLKRIFEYLDTPTEQHPLQAIHPATTPDSARAPGSIQVRDVSFAYQADEPVLQNISLDIHPGELLAVTGTSGSGKSSLLRLLTRMETGYRGNISIAGQALDAIPLHLWRAQIAVVSQDVELFSGSLRDNLFLGTGKQWDNREDRAALQQVIRICALDELIANLAEGLDTPVSERGVSFSGGQRQRIALARALLRETPYVFLDEATAHLDPATETYVIDQLFTYLRNRGTSLLMITHNQAIAQQADRCIHIEYGQLTSDPRPQPTAEAANHVPEVTP